MPGPVERWLETFMCKQYADTFEAYGFKTLQSVCQLQLPQLQAMGVAQEHCEKILENVHVLRQTLYGTANHYQDDLYSGGGNGARMQNSGYHPPNSQGMPGMPQGMPSFTGQGSGNFGSRRQGQMMQGQFSGPDGMYRGPHPQQFMGQSYGGVQGSTGHGHYGGQYGPMNSGYGSMPGGGSYGGGTPMQATMQQPQKQQQQQQGGPHGGQMQRLGIMGQGQSPQDVANSILQMTAAYQPNQTVQVPISKSRPAPYHIPKSPHYNMASQSSSPTHQMQQQYPGAGGPGGVGRQFVYPNSSPHHSHPSRTSPISPSPGYMHSPASHHSGQSLPNSSPRSIQSPPLHTGPGPVGVKSPVAPPSPVGGLKSPCAMQSPANSGQGSICSPTPLNQQLHVSVSSQGLHSSYPGQSPTQQMKNASRYSPKTNPISPPASQISSPYTPLSKSSIHSPPQVEQFTSPHNTQEYLNDSTHEPSDTNTKPGSSNPLMSLQKLCMLPEKQVVDPKSVVNDACLPSPQNPKNLDSNADTQGSSGNHGDGSCGSALESSNSNSQQCADGKHCNEGIGDHKTEIISCKTEMCSVSEPSEPPEHTKEMPESKGGGNCVKTSYCDSPPKLVSEADMLGKTVEETKTSDKENCDVNKTMLNGDVQSDGLSSIPTDEEGDDLISEEEEDDRDKKNQELTKPPNSALSQARHFNCDVKLIYSDDCVINGKNYILNSEKCLETLNLPSPNTNNKLTDSSPKNVITDVKNLISDVENTGEDKSILNDVNNIKIVDKDVKDDVIIREESCANSTHKNISQKTSVSNSTPTDKNTTLKQVTELTPETQDGKDKAESNKSKVKQPERTRSLRSVPARLAGAAYYNNYSDSDSNDEGILLVRKDNKNTYSRIATVQKSEVEESCSDAESNGKTLLAENKCDDRSKNPGNHGHSIPSGDEVDGTEDQHLQNNPCDKQKKQTRKEKSVLVRKDLDEDNKDHTSESEVNSESKTNSLQCKKNLPGNSVHIRTSKRINRKRKKAPASKYRDIYFGGDYILDSEEEMEMERKSKLSKKLNDSVVKAEVESVVVLDSEDDEEYVPNMKPPKKSCDSSLKVKNENLHKYETLSENATDLKASVENKNQGALKVFNKVLNSTEKQIKSEQPHISGNSGSALVKKPRGRPPGKNSKGSSKGKLKKLEKNKRAFICSDDDSVTEMRLKRTVDLMKKKHKKRSDYHHRTAGPFVRIKGSIDNPEECLVVNSPDGDKQTDSKSNRHKKKSTSVSVSTVHMSRLPTEKSILVPSSSAVEAETTWVCALCKKHSSYRFLGDLFGPYYIEGNLPQPKMQESPLNDSINKNKRKKSLENGDSAEKNRKPRSKGRKSEQEPREVWVHEDCLAWGNGVLLIGPRIYGLEEACHIASATMCSQCKETGAMVGCLHKGCSQKYHYICAVDTGCYMDEENFSLLCPKHKDKKMNKSSADAALSKT